MRDKELLQELERMRPVDDQPCWGCGHEHNCRDNGCALVQQAVRRLRECLATIGRLKRQAKKREKLLALQEEQIAHLEWELREIKTYDPADYQEKAYPEDDYNPDTEDVPEIEERGCAE